MLEIKTLATCIPQFEPYPQNKILVKFKCTQSYLITPVISLHRFNSDANDGSRSSSSSSKKMKEKKLDGKYFCGRDVMLMESDTITNPNRWLIRCPLWATRDCRYFVWVDELEQEWEGLARCLAKRKSEHSYARHDDGLTLTAGEKSASILNDD